MFAAAVLINTAALHFKTDNNLYKHKTKRLINELYNESVRLLKEKDLIKETLSSEEKAKEHSLKYNIEVVPLGKVEEFYQFLVYTDDVDLNKKLEEWEKYYNLHRPHTSHGGFTPYVVLRAKLENNKIQCQP